MYLGGTIDPIGNVHPQLWGRKPLFPCRGPLSIAEKSNIETQVAGEAAKLAVATMERMQRPVWREG